MNEGTEREERIREEAYRIWEQEGRPQGREREHWKEAVRRVDSGNGSSTANPKEMTAGGAPRQRKAPATTAKPRTGQRKPKGPGV